MRFTLINFNWIYLKQKCVKNTWRPSGTLCVHARGTHYLYHFKSESWNVIFDFIDVILCNPFILGFSLLLKTQMNIEHHCQQILSKVGDIWPMPGRETKNRVSKGTFGNKKGDIIWWHKRMISTHLKLLLSSYNSIAVLSLFNQILVWLLIETVHGLFNPISVRLLWFRAKTMLQMVSIWYPLDWNRVKDL